MPMDELKVVISEFIVYFLDKEDIDLIVLSQVRVFNASLYILTDCLEFLDLLFKIFSLVFFLALGAQIYL
jgi:hypothetical protein